MNHNQTWIIAQREYFQRLKSKAFIITTALGPLILLILVAAPIVLAVFATDESERIIAIVDESGQLREYLEMPESFVVDWRTRPTDSLRALVESGQLTGYLVLPASLLSGEGEASYFSKGGGGILVGETISDAVNGAVRERRILDTGAPAEVLEIAKDRVSLRMLQITDEGERRDATPVLAAFGYMMGFLIYICMILYGAMVMRGVIEEKTNRISELIASSAKPFQLLLGKILGIGALGMTQLLIWIVAGVVISAVGVTVASSFMNPDTIASAEMPDAAAQAEAMNTITELIPDISASFLVYLVLFFVGGYLLYASMMAAVGSAVEQESDAQQFMWPILMPLIIPMMVLVQIVSNPDSTFAVVMSLIPLFSPITMVVRMAATNVPHWQVWIALVLLGGSFVLAVWVSSRIYRIGILSYGKKPSFKEIARWIRTS
jgi:ABC-2 type transport system permease protein